MWCIKRNSVRGEELTIKTAFQWMMVLPAAAFLGVLAGSFVLVGGNYLVGYWKIPSGLVIFLGAFLIPNFWMIGALESVPRENSLVRWILLSPLWLFTILLLILLAKDYQHPERLSGVSSADTLSYSLSVGSQRQIFTISFLLATILLTFFNSLKSVEEIREKQRRVP